MSKLRSTLLDKLVHTDSLVKVLWEDNQ